MNHAAGVRLREGAGNLDRDAERAVGVHRPVLDQRRQRTAVDEFHDEKWRRAVRSLDNVVQRGDVGVIQAAGGARLGERLARAIAIRRVAENLERNATIDADVPRPIHIAHRA